VPCALRVNYEGTLGGQRGPHRGGGSADVYQDQWEGLEVAVKAPLAFITQEVRPCPTAPLSVWAIADYPSRSQVVFREALMWAWAAHLNHQSILPFLGASLQDNKKVVLLSTWCPTGSLDAWLRSCPSVQECQRLASASCLTAVDAALISDHPTHRSSRLRTASPTFTTKECATTIFIR
jgi:hypothetical protein